MVEFKGEPYSSDRKFDKTGFYILWPLAAFPLVAGPVALVTSPKEVFADLGTTAIMSLFGLAWVLFWGMIPILTYMADVRRARQISTYKVLIDPDGVEFHADKTVRMPWSDMKSIKSDSDPDSNDIIFKGKNNQYRYERWLADNYGFLRKVKDYFPAAQIDN
jgi:hypothetical protein